MEQFSSYIAYIGFGYFPEQFVEIVTNNV